MGYDVRVTRKGFWADEDGPVISLEEWKGYVVKDPEIELDAENPAGENYILTSRLDRWPLWWNSGEIVTKDPDEIVVAKLVEIARALGARVLGDDGEEYGLDATDPVKPAWGIPARDLLRRELEARDGSFLIQLRCDFRWDWEAFRRLTGAMYDVAEEVAELPAIERWIAEGFWYCDTWIRAHTGHPSFKRPPEKEYEEALGLLSDLGYFLFRGESPYMGDELRRKVKG